MGFAVESYEQRRPSRVFEGIPDRRYAHRPRRVRVWVELKAPGKQMTSAQHAWLLLEIEAGAFATVIDDPHQLERLFNLLSGPRVGRDERALAYCRELVDLCALRGYRGEAKTPRERAPGRSLATRARGGRTPRAPQSE